MPESKKRSTKADGAKKKNSPPAKKVKPPTGDVNGTVVEMTSKAAGGKVAVVEKGGTPTIMDTKSASKKTPAKKGNTLTIIDKTPAKKAPAKKKTKKPSAVPKTQSKNSDKEKPAPPQPKVIPITQDAVDHVRELLSDMNRIGQQILNGARQQHQLGKELNKLHEKDEDAHKDLQATLGRMRKRFNVPDGFIFDHERMIFTNMPFLSKDNQ